MADFGSRLRELRTSAGISQRELARRVPCSPQHISDIERGRKTPSPQMLDRISDALRPVTTDRPLLDQWETAELLARVRVSDVSPGTVEALHAAVFDLCCAYGTRGAAHLRNDGQRWLRETVRLLHRPVGLHAHQELLTVAGWLALLVGCVEYDMGMRPAAEATRAAALQLADEAGHGEIAAWAWEMSAWFALTQGRYRAVLAAVDAGQQRGNQHTAVVQLLGQEAKARARLGDRHGVRKALERGRSYLDRRPAPDRPDHHFVVDPDKWDFYAMDAYRIVGDDELARLHARRVLELGTGADGTELAPMRMAEARLTLGTVAARAGELDEAVRVSLSAFAATRRSLPSLLMVAGEVSEELARRDRRGRSVRDLREAVQATAASAAVG